MTDRPLTAFSRKLLESIEGATTIPLFGNAPPFDWRRLSALLAARFDSKDFSIEPSEQAWGQAEEIKTSLGTHFFSTAIYLNPIQSPFYFAIPKADKNKLTALMMQGKAKSQVSEPLKEGFCRFLVLEALQAASELGPLAKLTPCLGDDAKFLEEESAFCIDVEIAFGEQSCWSRLIFPNSFRKAWIEHFSMCRSEYSISDLSKSTELSLGLECGFLTLTKEIWDEFEVGDFISLDRGSFGKDALAVLKFAEIPLFQARVKNDKITLTDYVFTNEEPMEKDTPEEESGSIKNVPLQVSVELARLKLTLDQLMHLNPGNVLELPIHPDQSVSLTVNGKKVGRAELLTLGETFGIRILELG
jgi:type III secretion system YscQ/HrcQ family protein